MGNQNLVTKRDAWPSSNEGLGTLDIQGDVAGNTSQIMALIQMPSLKPKNQHELRPVQQKGFAERVWKWGGSSAQPADLCQENKETRGAPDAGLVVRAAGRHREHGKIFEVFSNLNDSILRQRQCREHSAGRGGKNSQQRTSIYLGYYFIKDRSTLKKRRSKCCMWSFNRF